RPGTVGAGAVSGYLDHVGFLAWLHPLARHNRLQCHREEAAQKQAHEQSKIDRRNRGNLLILDEQVGRHYEEGSAQNYHKGDDASHRVFLAREDAERQPADADHDRAETAAKEPQNYIDRAWPKAKFVAEQSLEWMEQAIQHGQPPNRKGGRQASQCECSPAGRTTFWD